MQKENILFDFPNLALHINSVDITDNTILRGKHFHKEIELVFANKGSLICEVGNEKIFLKENNGLLINSHTIHQLLYSDEDCIFTYIQIDIDDYINHQLPDGYKRLPNILYHSKEKNHSLFDKQDEAYYIFDKIKSEAEKKNNCFEAYIKAYISLLIAYMHRNNLLFDFNSCENSKKISKFIPAITYVEENFKNKIYLDDICKTININKFNFCKEFKKAMGFTFTEYVNLRRLTYVQQLFLNTEKSILEIAIESGCVCQVKMLAKGPQKC